MCPLHYHSELGLGAWFWISYPSHGWAHGSEFTIYNLPTIDWSDSNNINLIRQKIINKFNSTVDYGLVHYYHNENASINWHSDREALRSPIYSINLGGVRRFCLRNKETKKLYSFDLHDGDLFIMKNVRGAITINGYVKKKYLKI